MPDEAEDEEGKGDKGEKSDKHKLTVASLNSYLDELSRSDRGSVEEKAGVFR